MDYAQQEVTVNLSAPLRIMMLMHNKMSPIVDGSGEAMALTDTAEEIARACKSLLIHKDLYRYTMEVVAIGQRVQESRSN